MIVHGWFLFLSHPLPRSAAEVPSDVLEDQPALKSSRRNRSRLLARACGTDARDPRLKHFARGGLPMPRGDKSKYTDNMNAKLIISPRVMKTAEFRKLKPSGGPGQLFNKDDGGGKKSGSGKGTGHPAAHKGGEKGGKASAARSFESKSATAKKAASIRRRHAAEAHS